MSSNGALPLTLRSISSTKLEELSKQRALYVQRKSEILNAVNSVPSHDLRRQVQVLLEGVTRLAGRPEDAFDPDDDSDLSPAMSSAGRIRNVGSSITSAASSYGRRNRDVNIRRFLLQSQYDSSVSDDVLCGWISSMEGDLELLDIKYEHATFYSDLVTEWLTNLETTESSTQGRARRHDDDDDDDTKSDRSGFEEVGRAAMHEQRATWEQLVFTPADVDTQSIETYLERLFTKTKFSKQALKALRDRMKKFGMEFRSSAHNSFDSNLLKTVSQSLLASDLLSSEKVLILKEFLRNDEVAQEVADVLNLRFAALDRWNWSPEGVPVEMRRQLNGKYRVFMDEDLIDALLFHYIGLKWAIEFRDEFESFLTTPAWKSNARSIPKAELDRQLFFRMESTLRLSGSVDTERRNMYKRDYFMSQLPATLEEGKRSYDDGDDSDNGLTSTDRKSPIETKHSLLHLLITESLIHKRLHGQFTVIRSDFKWFGPSLPHDTVLTVLKFFGVPEDWLVFFEKFLTCPLKFSHDGPRAAVKTRKRGIPVSHSLSDVFGETIMFCMDYAVNQHADGAFLYRLHDDFWFWGEEKTCRKAWRAMTEFTAVAGLEFNEEKTGTVRLGRPINHQAQTKRQHRGDEHTQNNKSEKNLDSSEDEDENREDAEDKEGEDDDDDSGSDAEAFEDSTVDPLPCGDIRWGFLRLDPERGRFLIDQEQVDAHIEELRRQLSACKSIFAWVQAWNSYFSRFFSNNFAKPSVAFGREHIDMAINTLSRIEREVFATINSAGTGGNKGVVDYLRQVIGERFNIHDLPDGFFYFPIELGGLELHNPFISLLAMRENIKKTPQSILEHAYLREENIYESAKTKWLKSSRSYDVYRNKGPNNSLDKFFSFEEYAAHLETTSGALKSAYDELLKVPEEVEVGQSTDFSNQQDAPTRGNFLGSGGSYGSRGGWRQQGKDRVSSDWSQMTPYWKWVVEAYGAGLVQKYGGLSAVDRALMPLGVVRVLKQCKVRWQG